MPKIEQVLIDLLKPDPSNPRVIKDEQFRKLVESVKNNPEYFEVRPILVDKDMVIFAGNMRWRAAKEAGLVTVPCAIMDVTPEKRQELMIRDNVQNGEWDPDTLSSFDPKMLADWGLQGKDFAKIFGLGGKDDEFDAKSQADKIVEPDAKLGDVYQLGRHRLMCGDATNLEHTRLLMNSQVAALVHTDPPYNVDYHSDSGNGYSEGKYAGKTIFNDDLPPEEFTEFLTKAFKNIVASIVENAPIYIWYAQQSARSFLKALDDAGIKDRQTLIWVKPKFSLGHQDYHWQHEPCFYGRAFDKGKLPWYGSRSQSSIWEIDRDKTNDYVHPTQKPIELVSIPIRNSSKEGDIVLDLFAGSGSTLITCEQLNRTCYTMELDPKYVDVIIKRWEELTGEKATKTSQ